MTNIMTYQADENEVLDMSAFDVPLLDEMDVPTLVAGEKVESFDVEDGYFSIEEDSSFQLDSEEMETFLNESVASFSQTLDSLVLEPKQIDMKAKCQRTINLLGLSGQMVEILAAVWESQSPKLWGVKNVLRKYNSEIRKISLSVLETDLLGLGLEVSPELKASWSNAKLGWEEAVAKVAAGKIGSMSEVDFNINLKTSSIELAGFGYTTLGQRGHYTWHSTADKSKPLSIWLGEGSHVRSISYRDFTLDNIKAVAKRAVLIKPVLTDDSEVVNFQLGNDTFDIVGKWNLLLDGQFDLTTLFTETDSLLVVRGPKNKKAPFKFLPGTNYLDDYPRTTVEVFGPTLYAKPIAINSGYWFTTTEVVGDMGYLEDGEIYLFADPSKWVARQEKLNSSGERALAQVKTNLFFVTEPVNSEDKELLDPIFNTGCFYLDEKSLQQYGAFRGASDFNNGLIKGVSHCASALNPVVGQAWTIAAASSVKGGLISVAKAMGVKLTKAGKLPKRVQNKIAKISVQVAENKAVWVYGLAVEGITLNMTNNFTVECYSQEEDDQDIKFDKEKANTLSNRVLSLTSSERGVIDVLKAAEKAKLIFRKPAKTSIISSELEVLSRTYGDEKTIEFIKSVVKASSAKVEHTLAKDYMSGEARAQARQLSFMKLVGIYKETMGYRDKAELSSVPTKALRAFAEKTNMSRDMWINFQEFDVVFPWGEVLVKDLFDKSNDEKDFYNPSKLMKTLVNQLNFFAGAELTEAAFDKVVKRRAPIFKRLVQDALINKSINKVAAKGGYFAVLPGYWLENKYDVCMLDRDSYAGKETSAERYVLANIQKHPSLFDMSFAGVRVFKDMPRWVMNITAALRKIYSRVIFVHPDWLVELQNDCDGDLARVTFDEFTLPFYESKVLSGRFAGFHEKYIAKENSWTTNLDKAVSYQAYSPIDMVKAVFSAAQAKEAVGKYTEQAHAVAARMRLLAQNGVFMGYPVEDIITFFYILVQTDAMNAIKQGAYASVQDLYLHFDGEGHFEEEQEAAFAKWEEANNCHVGFDFFTATAQARSEAYSTQCVFNGETCASDLTRRLFKDEPTVKILTEVNGIPLVVYRQMLIEGRLADLLNARENNMAVVFFQELYGFEPVSAKAPACGCKVAVKATKDQKWAAI